MTAHDGSEVRRNIPFHHFLSHLFSSYSTMGFERDSGKAGPSKRAKTSTSKQPEPDSNLLTPQSQANQVSSTAWSTRSLPLDHVPPLTTLCIRVFALKLKSLSSDHDLWEVMKSWLSTIPEPFVPRIFGALRETFPELLSHGFMVAVR